MHFYDVTNSQQVAVYGVRKRVCLSRMHKNPGLTVTGEVSTLRPWSFASGNSSVVEHRLAKARVEGSNPFSRSKKPQVTPGVFVFSGIGRHQQGDGFGRVDDGLMKSLGLCAGGRGPRRGSRLSTQ